MKEYTKEDLVQFLKWNSNAPVKVIRSASVEELEAFIKKHNAWDKFMDTIEDYRLHLALEKKSKQFEKLMKTANR